MKIPAVSIIVPVYMMEKYLSRCVDSILAQTYNDFELILINDGSLDSSGKICDFYAEKDNRVKVIHKKNGGASSARNEGLDQARGEWITFADSDDYVEPMWLETFMLNSINRDLVVQGFKIVFENNDSPKSQKPQLTNSASLLNIEGSSISELKDLIYALSKNFALGYLWSKMFRKSVIDRNFIRFNPHYKIMEDEDFVLRYLLKTSNFKSQEMGYYVYNYPDYQKKYAHLSNENCIRDIWLSIKQLNFDDVTLNHFAQGYAKHYITNIINMYQTNKPIKLRLDSLFYYSTEFGLYQLIPETLNAKVFIKCLKFKNIHLRDSIYKTTFQTANKVKTVLNKLKKV